MKADPGSLIALPCAVFLILGIAKADSSSSSALIASDGVAPDNFGSSVSLSGNTAIVGAYGGIIGSNEFQGSAYVYRNLDTVSGTVTQDVKPIASDGAVGDLFGISVSLSGNNAIVGARADDIGSNEDQGSAYLYRNLGTTSGTVTQNAKLTASDGSAGDLFGYSVSLSGNNAIVGAIWDDTVSNEDQGSAYVYRNLHTASAMVSQDVKLTASDGAAYDFFGGSVSLWGSTAIVGAVWDDIGSNTDQGSAYVYRNLDTASGTVTQDVKLTASDGAAEDLFSTAVSLSGSTAIVGAAFADIGPYQDQGSAYVYSNLDTANGTVTQNVKLIASDGVRADFFGSSVSLSGSTAIIGAHYDDIVSNENQGSAYVYSNLDTASGTVTQKLKLTASDGAADDHFGGSVAIDGDRFVVGANGKNSYAGKAYSGMVSSMTSLDVGASSRIIDGISFVSQDDWIIGQNTDNNSVTLTAGDRANVSTPGKFVFIGQNAGSDGNTLWINGSVIAEQIFIGSSDGNFNNMLALGAVASVQASLMLAANNFLSLEGEYIDAGDLLTRLGGSTLLAWDGATWQTVTSGNQAELLSATYSAGYTTFTVVPEPSAAFLGLVALGSFAFRRKR